MNSTGWWDALLLTQNAPPKMEPIVLPISPWLVVLPLIGLAALGVLLAVVGACFKRPWLVRLGWVLMPRGGIEEPRRRRRSRRW